MNPSILSALALLPCVLAATAKTGSTSVSTSTSKQCSTRYGSNAVSSVHTSSKRSTRGPETIIYQSTSTPCTTVTPTATVTSTDTTTVTATATAITITDTFSTTSTETDVETDTVTATLTEVDTATPVFTTASASTTVAEPVGFEDVTTSTGRDNAAGPGDRLFKRTLDLSRSLYRRASTSLKAVSGLSHPQSVTCTTYIQKIVSYHITFIAPKRTYTAKPVSTTTTTTQVTATTTSTIIPPDCSITSSFSTTTTLTNTVTDTTLITSTSTPLVTVTTTTTSYAACGTSNLLGPYIAPLDPSATDPEYIIHFGPNNQDAITISNPPTPQTPYDCCVACQNDPMCAGMLFSTDLAYTTFPFPCLLWDDSTACANPANQDLYAHYADSDVDFTVSNGPCGVIVSQNE